jgi:hypothetical protein
MKTRYLNPAEEEKERRRRKAERNKHDYKFDAEEFKEEMAYRWGLHRESKSNFNKKYTSLNRLLLFSLIAIVIVGILVYMKTF